MPGKAVVTDLPESLRPFVSRKLAILRDVGVTPALARDALEYGRREMLATGLWRELRPLSEKVVAQLAKDMRSGRFVSPRASLDGPGLFDSVQVGYSDQLSNPFVLVDACAVVVLTMQF